MTRYPVKSTDFLLFVSLNVCKSIISEVVFRIIFHNHILFSCSLIHSLTHSLTQACNQSLNQSITQTYFFPQLTIKEITRGETTKSCTIWMQQESKVATKIGLIHFFPRCCKHLSSAGSIGSKNKAQLSPCA